jgi:hypothetical protein
MSKTNAKATKTASSKTSAKATKPAAVKPSEATAKKSATGKHAPVTATKKSDNKTGVASTRFSKSPGLTYAERVAELKARIERSGKGAKHPNYATYQNLLKMTPDERKQRDAKIAQRAKTLA